MHDPRIKLFRGEKNKRKKRRGLGSSRKKAREIPKIAEQTKFLKPTAGGGG